MNYYEEDEKRDKRWAILAVLFYLFLCGGGLLMKHTIPLEQSVVGIVIDFGNSSAGMGQRDLNSGLDDTSPTAPPPTTPTGEEILTDDGQSVPMNETRPETQASRHENQAVARQVDTRTLFPGNTDNSDASAQGNNSNRTQGNRGNLDGANSTDYSEAEQLTVDSGVNLSGRYLIGALPRPAYTVEVEGRVVIRINVNSDGVVTSAEYEQAGSTTNNGTLVGAARTAALRARFTESDADLQSGTITYTFRLN
jgi:TonB family protein